MKKTVILFALTFAITLVLNAENDQPEKKKSQTEEQVFMEEGFARLMANNPSSKNAKIKYWGQLETTNLSLSNNQGFIPPNPLSDDIRRHCCGHPSKISKYNFTPEN